MPVTKPLFTLGIEEEYFLVDKDTLDLVSNPPEEMLARCQEKYGEQICPEFIQSQIEIGTQVCTNISEARAELIKLRSTVSEIASEYNIAPIAASTHPYAKWREQRHTERQRYKMLADDFQLIANRMLIGGMHIHYGIEDKDLRIDLMNQFCYFLPHLLALSCSSPFWLGSNTGLECYRLTVFNDMPRTGLPTRFDSFAEYERNVNVLIEAGIIEDSTKIWWDIRPSGRYPTVELRVMDVCTNMEDSLSIAALAQSLFHMLFRLRTENKRWREYRKMLLNENRWRAMRYGLDGSLIDFAKGELTPFPELIEELIDMVKEDAEELGCLQEVLNCRNILQRGNSAHSQVAIYNESLAAGDEQTVALKKVVDWLITETVNF